MSRTDAVPSQTDAATHPADGWLPYGDGLRVLGAAAVVTLHTGSTLVHESALFRFVGAATVWAVPAFFMLSGALLLGTSRRETPLAFYGRRMVRVGVPFVFWTVFFLSWGHLTGHGEYPRGHVTLGDVAIAVRRGAYFHLWFMYPLILFYMLAPWLRMVVHRLSRRGAIVGTWTLLAAALGYMLFLVSTNAHPNALLSHLRFMGYFCLGFCMRDAWPSGRRASMAAAAGLVLAICAAIDGSVTAAGREAYLSILSLSGTFSPMVIAISVCAFMAMRDGLSTAGYTECYASRVARRLAPAMFGVYLVHPVFLESLSGIGHALAGRSQVASIIVVAPAVFACSLASVLALSRVPYLRCVAGYAAVSPGEGARLASARS